MGLLIKIKFFILFCVLCMLPHISLAMGYHLEMLAREDDKIMLLLYHDSFSDKVFQRSALCRSSVGGLTFNVTDKNGVLLPLKAVINDGCVLDNDVVLGPYEIHGKVLSIEMLRTAYDMIRGEYSVTAKLCDYEILNNTCLVSNDIIVEVN